MNNRQSGVALIVILLLLAVMVSIAASMADRLFSQFKRASNQVNHQQAYWYSVSAEALARVALEQSFKDSDTINLSQQWALEEQTYPLDHGTIKGHVVDMQACFNINALSADLRPQGETDRVPYLVEVFQRLLEEKEVSQDAETIAQSLWEYVDKNNTVNSAMGVEDSYYESMSPAYLTANTMLADRSELRAVNQVSGEAMQKILPYICAIPSTDLRINVNTLKEEQAALLVALFFPVLSEQDAVSLLKNRPYDGWSNIDDFLREGQLVKVSEEQSKQVKGYLDVTSSSFELDAELLVGDSRVRARSLLFSENKENVMVIGRRFGGIGERVSDRSTEQKG